MNNPDYRYNISDMYKRFRFLEKEMGRLSHLIEQATVKELLSDS